MLINGKNVPVYDNNPYVTNQDGSRMKLDKLTIKNLPLSISNQDIENMLTENGVKLSSPIRYGKIRDNLGQLTQYKSGDRYVFVHPYDPPLPQEQTVGSFKCIVVHHGKQWPCKACGITGHRIGDDVCKAQPKETIIAFKGYQHPLSNQYPCSLPAYGESYKSVEHAFLCRMAQEKGKTQLAEQIKNAKHAGIAKKISQNIATEEERAKWEINNVHIMSDLLKLKLEHCEPFRVCLLENKGSILADATTNKLWGTGMTPFVSANTSPQYWPGKNVLGSILTKLTDELPDAVEEDITDMNTLNLDNTKTQHDDDNKSDHSEEEREDDKATGNIFLSSQETSNCRDKDDDKSEQVLEQVELGTEKKQEKNGKMNKKNGDKSTGNKKKAFTPKSAKSSGTRTASGMASTPNSSMDIRKAFQRDNKRKTTASSPGYEEECTRQTKRPADKQC